MRPSCWYTSTVIKWCSVTMIAESEKEFPLAARNYGLAPTWSILIAPSEKDYLSDLCNTC